MLKRLFLLFTCLNCYFLTAQEQDSLSIKNGIDNPMLLTTHHFGIFSSRINQNFKLKPPKKLVLSLSAISGNNFQPFVEAYFPKSPSVREYLSNMVWHIRDFYFINQETTPAEYMNIVIDAVIKEFRLGINFTLAKQHELGINLRTYLITKGKHPFSFFTGDETIEWFHSNIAGGEDPYGRRYYGLNQVNFVYNDRHSHTLKLNNNDVFIGGIEFNHYYYPKLSMNKKNIFVNFGSHFGINTAKFNPSVDFGLSANAIKRYKFKNNYELNIAIGGNVLRKNIINFKKDAIDLGNNPFLGTFEWNMELAKYTKKRNYHAIGINYQLQTRYNKKEEADYYRLLGKWQEIKGGWYNGVRKLYKTLTNWSFIYTYGRSNYTLSIYFKEDFKVNNAPDFQTGLSLKVPVFK